MDTSSQQNKNETDVSEGERQPSVASTILMPDCRASYDRDIDVESERTTSPVQPSRAVSEPLPERPPISDLTEEVQYDTVVCSVDPSDPLAEPLDMEIDVDVALAGGVTLPDDVQSVAESVKPVTGKRRRREILTDSNEEESDIGGGRKLRCRRTKILDTTIEENKEDHSSRTGVLYSCIESTSGETDGSMQSEPDCGAEPGSKRKKKYAKRRPSPIANKMHPVLDTEELTDHTAANLAALAMDWIDDVQLIRIKSASIRGVIGKYVKERLELIKECIRAMHNLSLGADDPGQLKLQNARLAADYHAAQKENQQLRQAIITSLEATAENLKVTTETQKILTRHSKVMRSVGTSPIRDGRPGENKDDVPKKILEEIINIKSRISLLESGAHKPDELDGSLTMDLLPQRQPRAKPVIKSIVELNPLEKVVIRTKTNTDLPGLSRGPAPPGGPVGPRDPGIPGDNRGPGPGPGRSGGPATGILRSPRPSATPVPEKEEKEKIKNRSGDQNKDEDSEHWTVVRKKKKKNKKKEDKKDGEGKGATISGKKAAAAQVAPSPKEKNAIQILQKKLPKTSVVVIKGKSENFSYADALIKLRKQIPLEEIGINSTKIKKTANGAVLIEVPGADSKGLAEELRSRAATVLGEEAAVSRPEIKGEIRIVGFEESVGVSDITAGIAKAGEYKVSEVSVTPIMPMRNGLFMTWIRCPLTAALLASKRGKIPLGWTMARLELQKPRTPRCFRCWEPGHHKEVCKSEIDRSHACFRCGGHGHSSALCKREMRCALCEAKGLNARHRAGSYNCGKDVKSKTEKSKEKSMTEKSVRRPTLNSAPDDKSDPMQS